MACDRAAAIASVAPQLKAAIDDYYKNGKSMVVRKKDQIMELLRGAGLTYRAQIPPKMMGVHPMNRDGEGITETGVVRVGDGIGVLGCSKQVLEENAICVEENPSNKKIEQFTKEVTDVSDRLQTVTTGMVKYGSLGNGHSYQFLCAAIDGAAWEGDLADENGRLCKKKLAEVGVDERLLKAGVEWEVIAYQVDAEFPDIATIVQSAINGKDQLMKGESWAQVCLKAARAADKQDDPRHPDWKLVPKQVLSSNPPRPNDVLSICAFVRRWGGGTPYPFCKELADFAAKFNVNATIVPSYVFEACAHLTFEPDNMPILFVNAIIKTAAAATTRIVDNVSNFVTKAEIASCATTRLSKVTAANKKMRSCRAAISEDVTKAQRVQLLGDLDVRMVKFVLNKEGNEWESIDEIVALFMEELANVHSGAAKPPEPGNEEDQATQNATMIEFDADGGVINAGRATLENKGFRIGCRVGRQKAPGDKYNPYDLRIWQIASIEDKSGDVGLRKYTPAGELEESTHKETFQDFLDKYTHTQSEIKIISGKDPSDNPDVQKVWFKNALVACAEAAYHSYPAVDVRVMSSPWKGVWACTAYTIGEFVVGAVVANVVEVKNHTSHWRIAVADAPIDTEFALSALGNSKDNEYVSVFDSIRRSGKRDACNCEIMTTDVLYFPPSLTSAGAAAPRFEAKIPHIANFKKIKAEDEIILHVPADAKEPVKKRHCADQEVCVRRGGKKAKS